MILKRKIEVELLTWKNSVKRKPLLLRGARQVGKSFLVESILALSFDKLVTVNFERNPEYKKLFKEGFEVANLLSSIQALSGEQIVPGKTLVFFDEIQSCPEALSSLRYFYEELPELHLIAAGSLIEFALESISVPVGRIQSMLLTPLSFEEYMENSGEEILLKEIAEHKTDKLFPKALHEKALKILKEYMFVGGMPEVVVNFQKSKDFKLCQQIQSQLLASFRDDFPKYSKRSSDLENLDLVFSQIPALVAKEFKFVDISRNLKASKIRATLNLLRKAGVVHFAYKTGSRQPLGSLADLDRFKLIFLDVGLMQRALGVNMASWISGDLELIHRGQCAEQFVAQELIASNSEPRHEPLYFWKRDKKNSSAEVDFIFSDRDGKVVPMEVKAGKAGKLKSLHILLTESEHIQRALKVSIDNYSIREKVNSIPLYGLSSWFKKNIWQN